MGMREKRQDQRLPVIWAAEIVVNEERFSCRIEDISLAGARIVTDAHLETGDELLILIPELGEFAAEVRFSNDDFAGLAMLCGPDLLLKKYAELSGEHPSTGPELPGNAATW